MKTFSKPQYNKQYNKIKNTILIGTTFLLWVQPNIAHAGMFLEEAEPKEVNIIPEAFDELAAAPKEEKPVVAAPKNSTLLFAKDTGEAIQVKSVGDGIFDLSYCAPNKPNQCTKLNSQPVQASEIAAYHDARLREVFDNLIVKRIPIAPGTMETLDFFDAKTWSSLASGEQGKGLVDSSYNMHMILGQLENFLHEQGKSTSDRNSTSDYLALRECSETLLFWTGQMHSASPRNAAEKSELLELEARISPSALYRAMEKAVAQASVLDGFQGDPKPLLLECHKALAEAQVAAQDTLSQVVSARDAGAKVPYNFYRALNDSNTWLSQAQESLTSDRIEADDSEDASGSLSAH